MRRPGMIAAGKGQAVAITRHGSELGDPVFWGTLPFSLFIFIIISKIPSTLLDHIKHLCREFRVHVVPAS